MNKKFSDVIEILEKKNIEIIGEINFKSENEKIEFLNKIELIKENEINLELINQDIINILNELELNQENLLKLRKINWEDFNNIFKNSNDSNRENRIYLNFIEFLKAELGVLRDEKSLFDKSLINSETESKEKNINKLDLEIFKKKENFDCELDLAEKAKKFEVDIIFDYTVKPKKISVNDFVLYFNRRLQYFTTLLKGRVNMDNVMRISQLKDINDTNTAVDLIGLISDITETKKGHFMITIEDKSSQIKCFVNKDKPELAKIIPNLCLDEGIGIKGKIGDKIIWTDEIIIPSPPNNSELKDTEVEHYISIISDLHFGAKQFVDEPFQKYLDWLNQKTSNEKLNKIAAKIKYILIPGDIIEGIGIYPDQGKDVRIFSTESQYHEAARWLSQIPKHIPIVIIPGNHDTDRLSEPQPKIPYEKAYALYHMENVIMVSNPSRLGLFPKDPSGGQEAYMYHGGSIFYYADKIQHLREAGGAKAPEKVIEYLLEKRHIAPSHGATLYIPDTQEDPLVMKTMPDYFITGHTHKMSLSNYKGCTIISGGCWVEMSDYQEKMGMFPDVGKTMIINSRTRKPQILSFYKEKHKKKE